MKRTKNKRIAGRILVIECIGFVSLIALSWLDELIGLPQLLFGGEVRSNWHESALESMAIAFVWLIVYGMTRHILRRFRYLEDLLTMCAWRRKLQRGGEWVSLEDYCARELNVDISHGMCPQCGRNFQSGEASVETR